MKTDSSTLLAELTPIERAPSLTTINGCGTVLWGRRDADASTRTYVSTQVFVLLYILPLFALASYRVADASGGGWFFLGRVPLSPRARNFNCLMAGALLGGVLSAAVFG